MIGNIVTGLHSPSAFTPQSIANLKAWYDASDTASISLSGSDVTQWNDKSGNAYHLTQATAAYRPQSGTRTINSKNVIDYVAIDDTLANGTASNWKFMHDATGCTVFLVSNQDIVPLSGDGWVIVTQNAVGGPGFGFQYQAVSPMTVRHRVRNASAIIVQNVSTSTIAAGSTCLWTILSDPNNGTTADKSDIRKNNGAAEKNNASTGAVSTADPASGLRIGDVQEANSDGINGVVAEIVIYSGILSAGNITKVQDYLIAKWGL